MTQTRRFPALLAASFMLLTSTFFVNVVHADAAKEIDIKVDAALDRFKKEISGGKNFLKSAKGVLTFPSVIKAGLGIGGEYGEGALRINDKTVEYYSTVSASWGLQIGAQKKTLVIVFLEKKALDSFRGKNGWKVGVDGSIALIELGVGKTIDTTTIKDPVVGFVFDNKGLMYNLTLEGSKFTKLKK